MYQAIVSHVNKNIHLFFILAFWYQLKKHLLVLSCQRCFLNQEQQLLSLI